MTTATSAILVWVFIGLFVLGYRFLVRIPLTKEQKLSLKEEVLKVKKAGGKKVFWAVEKRQGFLILEINAQFLSSPEIVTYPLSGKCQVQLQQKRTRRVILEK